MQKHMIFTQGFTLEAVHGLEKVNEAEAETGFPNLE